ncbi:WecB/TagA/CpsF family glycosyltransferase [Pseudoalteromonas luteoviolacea]|uniref:UDP-N-acetyl-D-mannosaminuronic acid transferase n=1 Tax=Pseudoalteromonas luteoviolacea S4060-1 TaxID=1365257 RepID=A0A161YYX2_9GAMM|nr:WecB/TagA/CpsF family glycosyltransferase [Pseudoalteromonas luteoviolacea]KZN68470.1 hypothetical protein N478_15005 [Pseudoalteromonas luteoviolacea S4060-1]
MQKYNVFGHSVTVFDGVTDAAEKILKAYRGECVMLTALNPEKVERARVSAELKTVLDNSDILYADGIGVVKAVERKFKLKTNRVPGCELWEQFIRVSRQNDMKVYLVGAQPSVLDKTVSLVKEKYGANIVGHTHGKDLNEDETIDKILASGANFVSVALGTPKQELFIMKCREKGVKALIMGVGGTYDVFTGNVKRSPSFWIKLRLEWLYRLLSQPTRISRQLNLIKFLFRMLFNKY